MILVGHNPTTSQISLYYTVQVHTVKTGSGRWVRELRSILFFPTLQCVYRETPVVIERHYQELERSQSEGVLPLKL